MASDDHMAGILTEEQLLRELRVLFANRPLQFTKLITKYYKGERAKQIIETVFSQSSTAFRQVVLIEYPRRGIWTIGFLVGDTVDLVQDHVADPLVTVMVPTTPNPTSGFLLFVPRAEVKRLEVSVEDGMKMIISIGMVTPEKLPPVAAPARDEVTEAG